MKVIVDNSSSIKGFEFDNTVLIVEFTGGSKYMYKGVSMDLVESFMTSESKGKFFAMHIKDKFVTEKVTMPAPDLAWPFPTGPKPSIEPDNNPDNVSLTEFLEWTEEEEEAFLDVLRDSDKK